MGLYRVVDEAERGASRHRRDPVQQPRAPGLVDEHLRQSEAHEGEQGARLGQHRQRARQREHDRARETGTAAPQERAGKRDQRGDGDVRQAGDDLRRVHRHRDERQHPERGRQPAPWAPAQELDERAEQQDGEEPAEDAPQRLVKAEDTPEPALQDVVERPSVLLRRCCVVVEVPVLRDQPRPLAEGERVLSVDRDDDREHECRGQEDRAHEPGDEDRPARGALLRHVRRANTSGSASASVANA